MASQHNHLQELNATEASAIAAAATQIELALHEAHEPVEDLGSLIGQISSTLAELRSARGRALREHPGESAAVAEMDAAIERLETALHGSIERLQFYDSMVQHLSHVRDYLAGVATQLAGPGATLPMQAAGRGPREPSWDRLRQQLRTRLLSDSQRELLDLVMPVKRGAHPPAQAVDAHSPEGSIELF